ncbi:hypothetical protein F2Q68_00037307 [Brassica cretica]|uniref:Gnk2-homologous domain-containing protein n=1 Tax=Brassica cretica TaxID=69181 RepID=A0A8S9HC98_BRACR|nr:hypothetical protein F2Q68_00037307 [Brassica cretica]
MSSCTSFIFLVLFSLLASIRAYAQNPGYTFHSCPNTTTYTRNSTYFTNLKTLLSSLSSPDASYSTGFQNATVGRDPDRVTGLFLCRGDVSPEVCRSCVAFSVNEILARCPNEKEVVLYYDECMLRYSHKNILSTLVYEGGFFMFNGNISSNQEDRFEDLVSTTMNQAADKAANSSRKFYTIKANWTALQSVVDDKGDAAATKFRRDVSSAEEKSGDAVGALSGGGGLESGGVRGVVGRERGQ